MTSNPHPLGQRLAAGPNLRRPLFHAQQRARHGRPRLAAAAAALARPRLFCLPAAAAAAAAARIRARLVVRAPTTLGLLETATTTAPSMQCVDTSCKCPTLSTYPLSLASLLAQQLGTQICACQCW